MCSTICRRIQMVPGLGGSQRTSFSGAGGKLVMGRACRMAISPPAYRPFDVHRHPIMRFDLRAIACQFDGSGIVQYLLILAVFGGRVALLSRCQSARS